MTASGNVLIQLLQESLSPIEPLAQLSHEI